MVRVSQQFGDEWGAILQLGIATNQQSQRFDSVVIGERQAGNVQFDRSPAEIAASKQ
jgi:hypothetical protein